jgi:hypothetical protein
MTEADGLLAGIGTREVVWLMHLCGNVDVLPLFGEWTAGERLCIGVKGPGAVQGKAPELKEVGGCSRGLRHVDGSHEKVKAHA